MMKLSNIDTYPRLRRNFFSSSLHISLRKVRYVRIPSHSHDNFLSFSKPHQNLCCIYVFWREHLEDHRFRSRSTKRRRTRFEIRFLLPRQSQTQLHEFLYLQSLQYNVLLMWSFHILVVPYTERVSSVQHSHFPSFFGFFPNSNNNNTQQKEKKTR